MELISSPATDVRQFHLKIPRLLGMSLTEHQLLLGFYYLAVAANMGKWCSLSRYLQLSALHASWTTI